MKKGPVTIAVVDDHRLFRRGLINLIHSLDNCFKITYEASNGAEFLKKLETQPPPDIAIIDIDMPVMNGFETANVLRDRFTDIKTLVLTMIEDEQTLIKMLRLGIKGYLSKDVEPDELKKALLSIAQKGYYYTDYLTGKLIESINEPIVEPNSNLKLNEREQKFLQLACSEYTYKEIADIMCLSIKTVDGYRNSLFEKLNVKSRVGLTIYAIRHKMVAL